MAFSSAFSTAVCAVLKACGAVPMSPPIIQKNLVWMMGGDMGTAPHAFNTAQTAVENALLNAIKNVPGKQSVFFSAEWDSESIGTDQSSMGASMTLNRTYSWTGKVAYHGRHLASPRI